MKKIRYIPYGYTMRNGRTVIAQDEAAVIREIFSAYINGASLQSIAELLTERKIPYSERTDVWDKARIARIIGNAKYIGDGEYDPIIEEEQYEEAAAVKTARQRNTFEKNLEGLDLLRDLVRCAECGAPMRRRVSSKHRIRESWDCTDPDCGQRIRISDTHLLEKVTILMNRIIANSYLLIPRPKKRKELSAEAQRINREIDAELERDDPSDALIIVKTIEMAERLYAESDIISRELFHKTQEELARRMSREPNSTKTATTATGKYSRYALSNVMICAECGSRYKRVTWTSRGKKRVVWRCISRLDYHRPPND